jgi:hypothetical protein
MIMISCRHVWWYSFLNRYWVSWALLFLHIFINLSSWILNILQWLSLSYTFYCLINLSNWTNWNYNLFYIIIYWLPGTLCPSTAVLPFNLNLRTTPASQCFESTYHCLAMTIITTTSTIWSFNDFETFWFFQLLRYCYFP